MKFTVTNLFPLPSSPHLPNVTTLTALGKKHLYRTASSHICANYRNHTKNPPATAYVCAGNSEYEVKYRHVVKPELPKMTPK